MKRLMLFLLIMGWSIAGYSEEGTLVISSDIEIAYETPGLIMHSGRLIVFKYNDRYMSHEPLDPEEIYTGIDLTGMEQTFIKSMFREEERRKLPPWLATLSEEQSNVFGINEANTTIRSNDAFELFSTYSHKERTGNIYVIEERMVHHINVFGGLEFYKSILDSINEKE